MKIKNLESWQEFLNRHSALNENEWGQWEKLTEQIINSSAFQEIQRIRQEQFQRLWEQRRTLQHQEVQQLDRWIRTLQQDVRLQDLWSRRDVLSEAEWHHLYQLIYQILQANALKMLRNLAEDPAIHIHDFFTRKVLEPCYREGFRADSKIHTGAICVYFQRFLMDRVRENHTPTLRPSRTQKNEVDIAELIQSIDVDPLWSSMTEPSPDMMTTLNELGLTIEKVSEAARAFLDKLEPSDRLLLKCSFCAADEQRVPVSRFTGIMPTPAYQARRLGITREGNQFPDYRTTVLGKWLTSSLTGLGLALHRDNCEALSAALKILCWHSLLDKETDCKRVTGQSCKGPDSIAEGNARLGVPND